MNRTGLLLAIMLLAITLVSGCGAQPKWFPPTPDPDSTPRAPVPTVVDRGLAYGVPCKPPCWEGLVPGVSTESEVRQTLEHLSEIGQIPEYTCSPRMCGIVGVPGVPEGWMDIHLQEGVVSRIQGDVQFDFDVQRLFDLIGEPAWVGSNGWSNNCTCEKQDTVEPHWALVSLVYPERGAEFTLKVRQSQGGCVCPEMQVTWFEYFAPVSSLEGYLDYLQKEYAPGNTTPSGLWFQEGTYVEWHGFGPGYVAR